MILVVYSCPNEVIVTTLEDEETMIKEAFKTPRMGRTKNDYERELYDGFMTASANVKVTKTTDPSSVEIVPRVCIFAIKQVIRQHNLMP